MYCFVVNEHKKEEKKKVVVKHFGKYLSVLEVSVYIKLQTVARLP